jgi:mono/diheme cytochrome c family protein
MFNELSRSLGVISGLILAMILIIFCAAFLVAHEQQQYAIQAPIETIDIPPTIALTEQQELGKSIFNANCASCHKKYKKAVGPALHGITQRREMEWIYTWIYNSTAMIQSGDAQAVALYKEYKQSNMNAFPQLSTQDVDAILSWVELPK